jgi:tetratricopeptide (TPR) repeat protein
VADGTQQQGGQVNLARQMAAAKRDPDLLRAGMALADNDLPTAEGLLRPYLKRRPTDVAAIRMMAELAARIGRLADSENLLRRAVELAPDFTAARANLATVLYKQNKPVEAIAELEVIERESKSNLGHSSLKAAALSRIGGHDEALALYRTILDSRSDQPKLWMSYGHILKTVGRLDDGVAAYREAIAIQPTLGEVWWSLANLKTVRFDDADIAAMETALADPGLDEEDQFHLHFALGKAFEDRGEADHSFGHYAEGNRLRRAVTDYDASTMSDHVRRSIALFSREFFDTHKGSGNDAPDPIFIVGLPRAGSTLIEQILASHPAIEGTGELADIPIIARRLGGRKTRSDPGHYPECLADLDRAELRSLGNEYLERAAVQRVTDRPFFIDKLPNNWAHVGLIHLILPKAKIIDARRHPLACGFSNFKQHFARGQGFAYDLAEIGAYYADYAALMRHFDVVQPGLVHRVINEDLIDDPEREVRAMLDHLGLPFDPACLAFHENPRAVRTPSAEQVRRPINSEGVDQWRAFDPWLGPLKTGLGAMMKQWRD